MTMDGDPPLIFDQGVIENVHDPHHVLESGRCHVLPALVEETDSLPEEAFRVVAEANHCQQPVSTIRMLNDSDSYLARFLQIEDGINFFLFKFLIKAILFYQPFTRSLHG